MLTDTELIRKLDFFEGLNPKVIQKIAQLCIAREFSSGDYIIRQGESGLGLYFITGGHAKVEIEKDGTKVVVAELKEGDFLGELSIIDDKARSANVICTEDTRCMLLTRDSFAKLLKKHPEIAIQMLKSLVGRIRSTNEKIQAPVGNVPQVTTVPVPPPLPVPAESSTPGSPADGIFAATQRLTAALPRPQDMVRMYSTTKDKVRDMMVDMFGLIYVMKAMTRFSMAIVGCPVTVQAEQRHPEILETTIEGVKLVLFPARRDQTIRIEGLADGELSATIFRPGLAAGDPAVEVFSVEGPVRPNQVLRLHVPAGKNIKLELSGMSEEFSFPAAGSVPALGNTLPESPWIVRKALWD